MDACHPDASANLAPCGPTALHCHRGCANHADPGKGLGQLLRTLCGSKACPVRGLCPEVTRATAADSGGLTSLKPQGQATELHQTSCQWHPTRQGPVQCKVYLCLKLFPCDLLTTCVSLNNPKGPIHARENAVNSLIELKRHSRTLVAFSAWEACRAQIRANSDCVSGRSPGPKACSHPVEDAGQHHVATNERSALDQCQCTVRFRSIA